LERNGFLYVDEVALPEVGTKRGRKITDLLRSGNQLLVQVTRDAMGGKGPRLTTQVGLAGRYLVYLPQGTSAGVSRRLDEQERERLRPIAKEVRPKSGGIIVRTAAEGASQEDLARDLRFLERVWAGVDRRASVSTAPALLHSDIELALRVPRDNLDKDFERIVVDDRSVHRRLGNYLRAVSPASRGLLSLHEGPVPLFTLHRVDEALKKALQRKVDLPSGGYLVIDYTEAMTVIDVNTGRYVGKRFLEETTLKTNLEACRELVRQLRLRDIGGIIVIDFIDMTSRSNRDAVLATLESELARDRTKTYVVEISPLGLVEMTRQNTTRGLREVVTKTCPLCGGEGRVLSEETAAIEVERRLALLLVSADTGLRVEVHPRIASRLLAGSDPPVGRLERETGRRLVLMSADETVSLGHVAVVPD